MNSPLSASFSVPNTYKVHFTRNAFSPENRLLGEVFRDLGPFPKVFPVIDAGVAEAFPHLADQVQEWLNHAGQEAPPPLIVSAGEALKNDYRALMGTMDRMMEYRICRHSLVVAIGGGALLDAVGFAASLLHRGVRVLRMPTTTLAQNDAGIGVKTGMNLHGCKNAVGTFSPPLAVINDLSLLDGLTDAQWRDGISEAFKVALIKDRTFYQNLLKAAPALGRREDQAMEDLIVRCAELHLHHISTAGDPFERGSARPLDFGHWLAHKLESLSNYRISHGHAVAVGIAVDTSIAETRGLVPAGTASELASALRTCGFDLSPPELQFRLGDGSLQLALGLEEFREHLGGELTLSLPGPIGQISETHALSEQEIEAALVQVSEQTCA